jgi:hypothetical protein
MAAAVPPATAGSTCPKCGFANAVSARFCSSCGAALSAPPAPSSPSTAVAASGPTAVATSAPVDVRQQVDSDRGVLKRLQMLIPGYRSYREGEDIRAADSIVRRQVADRLRNVRATVENARSSLTNAGQFQALNDLAPFIADLMRIEGQVRAAEQGYTGISPAVRIRPTELDRLYEYDYGFAQAADTLAQTVQPLAAATLDPATAAQVPAILTAARGQLAQIEQAFKARIQVIENIRVPE